MTKNLELFEVIYDEQTIATKYVDVKMMQEFFIIIVRNAVYNSEIPEKPDIRFLDTYFKSATTKFLIKTMDTESKELTIYSMVDSEERFKDGVIDNISEIE